MKVLSIKSKARVALLLVMTLLLTLSLPAYGAQVDVTDSINPILSMDVTRQDPAVIGEEFTVLYTIKNISNKPAYNLTFNAAVEGIAVWAESPFTFTAPEPIKLLDQGSTATLSVKYKVKDKNAQEQAYRLIGQISCQNAAMVNAGTYTAMSTVGTTFTSTRPTLTVKDIILLDENPDILNGFNLRIMVKNGSLVYDLRNVELLLEGGKNFEIMDISNKKELSKINTNETVGVDFKLRAIEGRESNGVTLSTGYSYTTGSTKLADNKENLFLPLAIEAATSGAVPRVIIKQYTLSKDQVLAGDKVDLTLTIENTNQKPVQNVLISFGVQSIKTDSGGTTSGGTVFSPVKSSNTFHLDQIKGKTTIDKTITLNVDASATAKTYILPVKIEYEDNKGKVIPAVEDNVNIPVTQQAKLQVMTVNVPTDGMVGQPVPITAEFANAGKVDLTEFTVGLSGNFESQDGSMYLAKLAIGASNSYAGMIIPQEEGTIQGTLSFSYTDNNNQTVVDTHTFTINVTAMADPGMGGEPALGPNGEVLGPDGLPLKPEGNKALAFVKKNWLTLALAAAIIGEGIYILRVKKKAKEEFFDE